ncbi:MAG: hypothetical protein M3256_05260, partial [Actinomycetota bacterium]|nr:hypothetical protein [Actinomycetota bacterium]
MRFLITAGCLTALVLIFALEHVSRSTVASLSLIAILLAAWWLPRRFALTVAICGVVLRLIALRLGDAGPLTVAAQVLTLLLGFLLASLVSSRLAAARASDAKLPLSRAARVQYRLSRLLAWRRGDLKAARRMAPEAREMFDYAGDSDRARLVSNDLGWIAGLSGDLKGQEEAARRVLAAPGPANPKVIMPASLSMGLALLQRGRFDSAEPAFRRSRELAGRRAERAVTTSALALSLAFEGRLKEARQ